MTDEARGLLFLGGIALVGWGFYEWFMFVKSWDVSHPNEVIEAVAFFGKIYLGAILPLKAIGAFLVDRYPGLR